MGLLPVETTFGGKKTRTRIQGIFRHVDGILAELEGLPFEGYEIHMGETQIMQEEYCSDDASGQAKQVLPMNDICDSVRNRSGQDGISRGNVYGTYIHGIFDKEEVFRTVTAALAKHKGIEAEYVEEMVREGIDLKGFKERQYDLLADQLRRHLDMEQIYRIMG